MNGDSVLQSLVEDLLCARPGTAESEPEWREDFFFFDLIKSYFMGWLPWWLSGKESACNAGDVGLIPGLETSPGEGNGNPLQYSCLENPMDRGVHGVAKRRT